MSENPRDALSEWLRFYRDIGMDSLYLRPIPQAEGSPATPEPLPLRAPACGAATRNTEEKKRILSAEAGAAAVCTRCVLHQKRTQAVYGTGSPGAVLMFVGEGPGRDEDLKGEPFVGRAGQLLTKIIEAMHMRRQDVYIANVVKCRPPENRTPVPEEIEACWPYLQKQIEVIDPKIVVALGSSALQGLLGAPVPISGARGRFRDWEGRLLMPTYHPAFLLRNPAKKREVWEDMQKVMAKLKEVGVRD
jgi:DNA polymerase